MKIKQIADKMIPHNTEITEERPNYGGIFPYAPPDHANTRYLAKYQCPDNY